MTSGGWRELCREGDLVPGSGVAALADDRQVAVFYLPGEAPAVHVIDNRDPFSGAGVLARGILGDLGGELVVASPIYKQHFSLVTGRCVEEHGVQLDVWDTRLEGGSVLIRPSSRPA